MKIMDIIIYYITKIGHKWSPYTNNYGRDIIENWVQNIFEQNSELVCLDIGCGEGADMIFMRQHFPNSVLYGIDILGAEHKLYNKYNINYVSINLEADIFPFPNDEFDLIIANQIFEHLKNWVFVLQQSARVLKSGGHLIIGVPNLASFHNRILLLLGRHPSNIATSGMHIRGFTYPGLVDVIEYHNVMRVMSCAGRVFYPFPTKIALFLSKIFPKASSSLFLLCQRTGNAISYNDIESIRRFNEMSLQSISYNSY